MAEYRTARQNKRQQTYTEYVYGNAVRVLDEGIDTAGKQRRRISNSARKNRERAYHMNFGYVLFLAGALVAAGFILVGYIGLQSDITGIIKEISGLESQLNNLKLDNDETYSRITSNIDLDEVKRIAIQELGMKYAEEGQIITFSGESSDYVRQVSDIPK